MAFSMSESATPVGNYPPREHNQLDEFVTAERQAWSAGALLSRGEVK